MKPEAAEFTRDRPCTKADIWRCFKREAGAKFADVQVDEARAIIGKNVPRVMERNGYLTVERTPRGDFYRLTPSGREWLLSGIQAYTKNHPSEAGSIPFLPGEGTAPSRRRGARPAL